MTTNQSWSFEHIQHILSRLDKNHVTIPIQSNDFEETRALDVIYQQSEDPFKAFDEFILQPFTSTPQVHVITNGLLMLVRCLMQNVDMKDVKLFISTLKMYIDATLVKEYDSFLRVSYSLFKECVFAKDI